MKTDRRRFLAKASGAMAVAASAALVDAPRVIAQAKVQWKMSTAYGSSLDIRHLDFRDSTTVRPRPGPVPSRR